MRSTKGLLDNSQAVLNADYHSPALMLNQDIGFAIQANWSGSPVGTMKIQVSEDYNPGTPTSGGAANAGNWSDYPGSIQNTAGVATLHWDITQTMAQWARVVFTFTSGTGILSSSY